jgi:hypothetical protein
MLIGQHGLVQDPDYADAVFLPAIEHDMATMFHPHQSGPDRIASSSYSRTFSKFLEAGLKIAKVSLSLLWTPRSDRIFENGFQIGR